MAFISPKEVYDDPVYDGTDEDDGDVGYDENGEIKVIKYDMDDGE